MDILRDFGFQPVLLVAQIVNFLIILYLLKRFAYKPVLTMLEKRQKIIADSQVNAKKADEALQHAVEEEKRILKTAQSEAKTLLSDAAKQAETIITAAHDKGKQQVEKLLQETHEQLDRERRDMEKQLASQVTVLAMDMLASSLKGFFDEKQQKEVLEKASKVLKR